MRRGFTLIELLVSMVIMLILFGIGISGFSYINGFARYIQENQNILDNIDTFLNQVRKELLQTYKEGSNYGIEIPQFSQSFDTVTSLSDVVNNPPPLGPNDYYSFKTNANPILRFYVKDENNVVHRISYTLGVPSKNGNYAGLSKDYWLNKQYEPCEILYSNETFNGTSWSGIQNQPVTEQVITNLIVVRPSYDPGVIQIIVESYLRSPFDRNGKKITKFLEITLRSQS